MDTPILQIKDLTIAFRGRLQSPVVNNVSFSVASGQCVGLVGESGSGKTLTVLSSLQLLPMGAVVSDDSHVYFNGEDVLNFTEQQMRRVRGGRIGIIFQDAMSAFNPVLTIGQQLFEVLCFQRQLKRVAARELAIELLTEVGIEDPKRCLDTYPHELSGGMRQRAMIAQALAGEPDMLIADEPTTALDVTLQAQILALLKRLQQQRQMSLIFISHNLSIVSQLADTVVVLKHGELVEHTNAKQFFRQPQQKYSQQLLHAALPIREYSTKTVQQEAILNVNALRVYFPIRKGFFKRTVAVVKAVDTIHFEVFPKETLALIGESGCGKTTTGKALLRLISHMSGEVLYHQHNLATLSKRQMRGLRADLQMIFQDPFAALNPRMLIADSIIEGMVAQGLIKSRRQAREKVDDLLTAVDLSPKVKWRYPHEFSGGERQRICIARALALRPKVLILDEPTSALDLTIQKQILDLLKQLQQQLGLSYVLITHDMAVVAYMAHDVAVMHHGRIVEHGNVQAVLEKPQHAYTKKLLAAIPAWQ